jgi:transcriptional regulator with XRE-family HTH domain
MTRSKYAARPWGIATPHLRAWREYRVLTQLELSGRSGVSNSLISRIEAGKKRPGPTTIGKLAEVLGITREQLVHEQPPV